jgi:outer membrane protein assembly factor BamB
VSGSIALVPASDPDPCKAFVTVGTPPGGVGGSVQALDCSTGATLWRYDLPTTPAGSPALAPLDSERGSNRRSKYASFPSSFDVLVGGSDGSLYAVDGATGALDWTQPLEGGPVASMAAIAGGSAYVVVPPMPGATAGNLQVMDVQSGGTLATIPLEGLSFSEVLGSAAIANGSIAVAVGSSVAFFGPASEWPEFHTNPANSGNNTSEWKLGASSFLVTKWTLQTGSAMSSASEAGGRVYVGSANHNAYALNPFTGAILWAYATGGEVGSTPAVSNGVVYVGSGDGNVYALDAKTGGLLWNYATGGAVLSSPTYVGSGDRNVYALDASNGSQLWSSKLSGGMLFQSPAVVGGVVYISSDDFSVYALDASDGSQLWSYKTGSTVSGSPAVVGGVLYVGSADGKLYAIQASNGTLLWTFATGGPIFSSPAVADGRVWFGSQDGVFYGVDTNGNQVYARAAGLGPVMSSPAVANHTVYYAFYGGVVPGSCQPFLGCSPARFVSELCWVSTAGGSDRCAVFDKPIFSSIAVANGFVYVGTQGTKMYGLSG